MKRKPHRQLRRLLIANRGEVVMRIARACRSLGIAPVAVCSGADRSSPHAFVADTLIELPGDHPLESYLNPECILDAAKRSVADAVHPGYGFLSENADFANRVREEGLIWVGPSADAIRIMADKSRAREFVSALGVPVIPGEDCDGYDENQLMAAAKRIGLPLLVKAASGGGGMAMRVVEHEADLVAALDSVRREARAAFGSDRVLLEHYLAEVHHIEVQIISDGRGGHWHAQERECSLQRRRQKVIEECPSPSVSATLRETLCEAALQIAREIDYEGLGTVEFIVPRGKNEYFFLEMNTRLQVEHAITEAVFDLDLVKTQLMIAAGECTGLVQDDISPRGCAVECRWYAEDPSADFSPVSGRVAVWRPRAGPSGRIEATISSGFHVGTHYDPMLAKVIGHGATRSAAIRSARDALLRSTLLGIETNRDFLVRVLDDRQFLEGRSTTDFLERRVDLRKSEFSPAEEEIACVMAGCEFWTDFDELAALGLRSRAYRYESGSRVFDIGVSAHADADTLGSPGLLSRIGTAEYRLQLLQVSDSDGWCVSVNGMARWFDFYRDEARLGIACVSEAAMEFSRVSRIGEPALGVNAGECSAPMPGRVLEILVAAGEVVASGQTLLSLESMKMEVAVRATSAGQVTEILCTAGSMVDKGTLLMTIESRDS